MYVYERVHEKTYVYVVSSGFKLSQWCENNGQETTCLKCDEDPPVSPSHSSAQRTLASRLELSSKKNHTARKAALLICATHIRKVISNSHRSYVSILATRPDMVHLQQVVTPRYKGPTHRQSTRYLASHPRNATYGS